MLHRLRAFASRHHRRFAQLILLAGVSFGGFWLWPQVPRETEIEFSLGGAHADVVELRIAYLQDEQPYQGVKFSFPQGAPERVRHRLTLPSGTFLVRCELRRRSGPAREVTRTLRTPTQGPVRIPLVSPSPERAVGGARARARDAV